MFFEYIDTAIGLIKLLVYKVLYFKCIKIKKTPKCFIFLNAFHNRV